MSMSELLPSVVPSTVAASRSGHAKRRMKNCLPLVFLLYTATDHCVRGAAVFSKCFTTLSINAAVEWEIGRPVELETHVHIAADMYAYRGRVFKLKLAAERSVKDSYVTVGDCLRAHYPEFNTAKMRCVSLSPSDCDRIFKVGGGIEYVQTVAGLARDLGVCPTLGAEYPSQTVVPCIGTDLATDMVVAGESSASSSGLMATVASSVSSVLDRLRSLYKEQPLGTVAHRYTVSGLVSYMQLARHLKPASQMSDVLADSADIFFGDAGSDLITKLGNKEIPMPSISLLRDSRLRLDSLSIVFQQKWFLRWQTLHYELVDSSPQLGLNFLAVIEDVIRIPESCSLNIILRLQHDVGSS